MGMEKYRSIMNREIRIFANEKKKEKEKNLRVKISTVVIFYPNEKSLLHFESNFTSLTVVSASKNIYDARWNFIDK